MRKNVILGAFIGSIALMFAGCSSMNNEPKAVDIEKLKPEIQALEDAFAAAEKAKDANAVAAYYSDDAISYSRNKEPQKGIEAIKAGITENLAKDTSGRQSTYKIVDLFASGDMVVEVGSWVSTDKAGVEVDKGHYMSYFQKRDGKYKCVRDMNVTSMPEKK